jgi:ribosomal peptide maturation radical SAM protein 1
VVLVSMPFRAALQSLADEGCSVRLARTGIPVEVRYFTIAFAELVGEPAYSGIALNGEVVARELAGEWIFSRGLFDESPGDADRYVEDILVKRSAHPSKGRPVSRGLLNHILKARDRAVSFLDWCVEEIVRRPPKVLGFTSMFEQHLASLALARRLKQALPDTFILFGGANCEGVMGAETLRQFPFVDAVVSGEGEVAVPALVRRVLSGEPIEDLQGVRTRHRLSEEFASGRFSNAPSVPHLDELPYPDVSDYFEDFQRSRFDKGWQAGLFVETSRGCWWGERQHCTFCGLNGTSMAYRSKSPGRALEEMVALKAQHPDCDLQVVDNILDMGYFKTLLPEIARRKLDFGLFIETKSNLKKEQVRLMREAGVRMFQPGIESFSDDVLQRMRKGVKALHNVQLLKWCKEFGVEPYWNLLWGFPGEEAPEEYARRAKLVPLLTHFMPPNGVYPLRMDRFSPSFTDPETLGFRDVEPLPSYRHVFRGLPKSALANLAYYFDYRYLKPQEPKRYVGPLLAALRRWKRVHGTSDLFSVDVEGKLLIWDLRPGRRRPLTVLEGLEKELYELCDATTDLVRLQSSLGPERPIASSLEAFVADRLMVRDRSLFLSLAVPLGTYAPESRVSKFYDLASSRPVARGLNRASHMTAALAAPHGRRSRARSELDGSHQWDDWSFSMTAILTRKERLNGKEEEVLEEKDHQEGREKESQAEEAGGLARLGLKSKSKGGRGFCSGPRSLFLARLARLPPPPDRESARRPEVPGQIGVQKIRVGHPAVAFETPAGSPGVPDEELAPPPVVADDQHCVASEVLLRRGIGTIPLRATCLFLKLS